MKDKGDVVMDENVQNPKDMGSGKENKDSSGDPWGCGTIVVMFVVGLCVNMCSILKEIRNDSHSYSPHHYNYSSDWSDRSAAFSQEDTTDNDSAIVDSVIITHDRQ